MMALDIFLGGLQWLLIKTKKFNLRYVKDQHWGMMNLCIDTYCYYCYLYVYILDRAKISQVSGISNAPAEYETIWKM